jgi:hypothetical protein
LITEHGVEILTARTEDSPPLEFLEDSTEEIEYAIAQKNKKSEKKEKKDEKPKEEED